MSVYKAELNSSIKSNIGYAFKIFENAGNAWIFCGKVYCKKRSEKAAINQFLEESYAQEMEEMYANN